MSEKTNPLLFSASTSPFDDIVASTIILPPQELEISKPVSGGVKRDCNNVAQKANLSTSENGDNSISSVRTNILPPRPMPELIAGPPTFSKLEGGSSLRRPVGKYVPPSNFGSRPPAPPPPLPYANSKYLPSYPPAPPVALPTESATLASTTSNLIPFFPTSSTSLTPPHPPLGSTFTPPLGPPISSFSPPTITPSTQSYVSPELQGFSANRDSSSTVNAVPYSAVIPNSFDEMASNPPVLSFDVYHPVIPHWFYSEEKNSEVWKPFSFTDSINLEAAQKEGSDEKVSCNGGRYDVIVGKRRRYPVYWEGDPSPIRRCSWFKKGYSDPIPVPYPEEIAERLENEYREAVTSSRWHRQIELPNGERVMMNSPHSIHHYQLVTAHSPSVSENGTPLTVKRGTDDFEIPDEVSLVPDHLLFLIHGIGSACDLRFRTVEECVDDFRSMGEELVASHFHSASAGGSVSRIEVLPISWHKELHGDSTGLDAKVRQITLRSIPKFREFTNDTLLDVLYYTSPVYCQIIVDTVASEMERLLTLFRHRNPSFSGGVSVGGHSLGSVILFDLLVHQKAPSSPTEGFYNSDQTDKGEGNNELTRGKLVEETLNTALLAGTSTKTTTKLDFEIGQAGSGQPLVNYPQLSFQPQILFLLGSPVGMFITVRGIDHLGPKFRLPTCHRVFNIFHPYDPVAYRLETLVDQSFIDLRPVLIPHHKGRKRLHLELKDTIERVGSDIKHKIVDSLQFTWNKLWQIYAGGNQDDSSSSVSVGESLVMCDSCPSEEDSGSDGRGVKNSTNTVIGCLNEGRRIDYVLQEKPYESFTEYIFALQAHVSYWNSEDTMLMILKEIYRLDDVLCDSEVQSQQASESCPTKAMPISMVGSEEMPPFDFKEKRVLPQEAPPYISETPSIPLFSPTSVVGNSSTISPPITHSLGGAVPKTLRGRPVFDPLKTPSVLPGMDPTATPSSDKPLPPPPMATSTINFSHRGNSS